MNLRQFVLGRRRLADMMAPAENSFGVIRLAMAIAVVISHGYLYATGSSAAEPLYKYTCHSLGEHAVQVFFLISGLMVAQSLDRSRGIADFALARGLRIFPGLIVCVLLTALVLGPIVSGLPVAAYFTSPELPLYLIKTIGLFTASAPLPGVFESVPLAGKVNTSLWTLKYEVMCYTLLAVAGIAGLMSPRWRAPITLCVGLFALLIFIEEPASDEVAYSTLDNIRYFSVFFATGVFAYLFRHRLWVSFWPLFPLCLAFYYTRGTQIFEVTSAVFLGYGALYASTLNFGSLRAFCNKFDLSFGVYIYAGPIQQLLIDQMPGITPQTVSLGGLFLSLPLALLSWVLIEHPAIGLRRVLRNEGPALRAQTADASK